MTKNSLMSFTIAIAVATSVGFMGGYAFHFRFGQELPAARQALAERDASQRVLHAYRGIVQAQDVHKRLVEVRSLDDLRGLQAKSKQAVIASVDHFSELASATNDREEKALAQALLPNAQKIRDEASAEP